MDYNELLFGRKNEGEYQLRWFLREHGYKVQDVSYEPNYQRKDIDMIATHVFTGETTTIEVKWCNTIAETGNLFIELENPRSWGNQGWYQFIEADYLAYGDARNGIFYFMKVADLRNCIDNIKYELRCGTTGDGSYGYLLPLSKVAAFTTSVVLKKRGE